MTIQSPEGARVAPLLPAESMKTYQVSSPLATHWRPATCAETGCEQHLRGWSTTVAPESREEHLLRGSGRHWSSMERTRDGLHRYAFPPGQACFAASTHRVLLDRQELYVVRGGDWRGNPTGDVYRHANADDWVDDFGTHQQLIADRIQRG